MRVKRPHSSKACNPKMKGLHFVPSPQRVQPAPGTESNLGQPPEHSGRTDERAAMTRLQAAVGLLGLGLYAWDPQTNALEWDARIRAIWGLPPDAHVDYGVWHERIHPEDVAR